MPDLARRVHDPEIMDDPGRPASEFAAAYRELEAINRYLGGVRAVRRFLPPGTPASILDVAAGGCDVGEALARQGPWRVVSLDSNLEGLRRARATLAVGGDAFALPFPDGAFDLVTASLFFHHLSDEDCVRALRSMHRVARRAVIVNDLHRSRVAHASIVGLTALFSRSPMVRHDGPLSVRRAFRPRELAEVARRAGVGGRVHRSFPYRLVLVVEKGR